MAAEQGSARPRGAPEVGAAAVRMVMALVRRAESGEVEALEELQRLAGLVPVHYRQAIRLAHDGPMGYSYTDLGKWLGITRQAARQLAAGTTED